MPAKVMDVIKIKDAKEIQYLGNTTIWYDLPSTDYVKPSLIGKIRDNIIGDVQLSDLIDLDLEENADSLECIYGQVR